MAIDTFEVFNECGVYYWADFSTLLGIVRENDIILGDNDVDVCIHNDQRTVNIMESCAKPALIQRGYRVERMDWSAYRVRYKGLFVDVYITNESGDTIIGATGENSNIPKRLVGTPRDFVWNSTTVKVPQYVHETLIWRYGEDYMTPRRGDKGRDS